MSTITTVALDQNNDPNFDINSILSDQKAVEEIIYTTLFLLLGEWWEQQNVGTPMFQTILGNPASQKGLQIMSAALVERISSVPYVSSVDNVSVAFNPENRGFSFSAQVTTAFSTGILTGFIPGFGTGPYSGFGGGGAN